MGLIEAEQTEVSLPSYKSADSWLTGFSCVKLTQNSTGLIEFQQAHGSHERSFTDTWKSFAPNFGKNLVPGEGTVKSVHTDTILIILHSW